MVFIATFLTTTVCTYRDGRDLPQQLSFTATAMMYCNGYCRRAFSGGFCGGACNDLKRDRLLEAYAEAYAGLCDG